MIDWRNLHRKREVSGVKQKIDKYKLPALAGIIMLIVILAVIKGNLVSMAAGQPKPLQVGEFGLIVSQSPDFGDFEMELRVNDILRGVAAEERFHDLNGIDSYNQGLPKDQEYIFISLTANVPSAKLYNDDLLLLSLVDFGIRDGRSGKEYDFDHYFGLEGSSFFGIAPGGTTSFWIGAVVDSMGESPILYYQSPDDKKLYFKLDKDRSETAESPPYISSPVFQENPIRDAGQERGHWNNPYGKGDIVKVDYSPRYGEGICSPFSGNFSVKEAYRGEVAEKFIDSGYPLKMTDGKELIVLKIAANVSTADGNITPRFDAGSYTILTGQGGLVEAQELDALFLKGERIKKVSLGNEEEGYVAFQVPKGIGSFVMTYGNPYTGLDDEAWIALEFSDHVKEEAEEGSSETKWTAVWNEIAGIEVICDIRGDDGKLRELDTLCRIRFNETETEDYYTALQQFHNTIKGLRLLGREIVLEADDEQWIIEINEKNVFEEGGVYDLGYVLENAGITVRSILDINRVPNMRKLETVLRLNGYQIINSEGVQ